MTVHPIKDVYRVGDLVGLSCAGDGLFPVPSGRHTCGESLTWEPPLPEELRCTDGTMERSADVASASPCDRAENLVSVSVLMFRYK